MRWGVQQLTLVLTGSSEVRPGQVPWHLLRGHLFEVLRASLPAYAPSTAGKMMTALAGILRECSRLGLLTASQAAALVDWRPMVGTEDRLSGDLASLIAACRADQRPSVGARDAAVIAALYGAGLCRAEACALDVRDLQMGANQLLADRSSETYLVTCGPRVRAVLDAWLAHRGRMPGPLLLPVTKSGHVLAGQRLTPAALYNIIRRRSVGAALTRFAPRDGTVFADELFGLEHTSSATPDAPVGAPQ